MAKRRLFIITGDYSGDVHGANVVKALKAQDPEIEIAAVGGPNLHAQGVPLLSDQSQMGRMGIGGLLLGAPYHYFLGQNILKFLKTFRPDAVLLIDYGVFNLLMAQKLRKLGIKVFYFIPPQVWASRKGRIKKIKAAVDHVFCIFPFEEALYQAEGIPVTYVGHPLVGQLPLPADRQAFCERHGLDPDRPILGIFPGSRKMEIDYLLKDIIGSVAALRRQKPDLQFVLAQAPSLNPTYFKKRLCDALQQLSSGDSHPAGAPLLASQIKIIAQENHAILSVSDVLLAKSGTTTLEAALYRTPMVIVYKGHPIAYQLALRLCYLPCIGLPNILTDMKNPPIPELWQHDVNPTRLSETLLPLFDAHASSTQRQQASFEQIHTLFRVGEAPSNVANGILRLIGASLETMPSAAQALEARAV